MGVPKMINKRDDKPFLPFLRLAASLTGHFHFSTLLSLIIAGALLLFAGGISLAADSGAELQQKEIDLKKKQAEAEAVRGDIRKDHPGDTRPPETVIQSDIAFEDHFHQKLVDAKGKLSAFDSVLKTTNDPAKSSGFATYIRDQGIGAINKKLAPFFTMDSSGTLQIGPAFLGLPVQFPTIGGMTIEGANSIINQMINDNAAMKQKRQDQLVVLGDELALSAEIDQLKKQQQRKKIVRFWVECSPAEIFPDESSLCSTNVEFEDGSFDKYNVRSTWTGAPNGVVRGDSAPPGSTVTVTATYQATVEEGGRSWTGSARVRIKARPPEPAKPTPPPTPVKTPPGPDQSTDTDQEPGDQDSPTDQPDNGGGPPPEPPPFTAELGCPPSFELVPGDFVGRGCGITVRGWNAKGPRVEVDVEVPGRSGIDIFPGDTSADASQMHTAGVTDFHSQYTFSESIRANETAPQGISTVTITVRQGSNRVVLTLQISILRKGEIPSQYGIKPPVNMATGGGKDAKWCVWRYRYPYEPPECFLFVKAECFKYALPKYELVGQLMTWMQAEALMSRLSRYGGDAYGCLKAGGGAGGGNDGAGNPPKPPTPPPKDPPQPPEEDTSDEDGGGSQQNACTQDGDCPAGQVCTNGECVAQAEDSCTQDIDCPTGSVCTNGQCIEQQVDNRCTQDSDCPKGYTCTNGQCVEQQADGRCGQDSDCPAGYVCQGGQCVEPFDNNYGSATDLLAQREDQRDEDIIDRNIADQGSTGNQDGYTSKDLDKDLEATQESVSSECNSHKSCPHGKTCENGRCVDSQAHCSTDSDCPKGAQCKNGTCTSGSGGTQPGLTVSPANKAVAINEPVTFQALVTTADGTSQDVTGQTTWTPGNPFSSGTVGQYTVNATYQSQSGSATVSVVEKKGLDDITVNSKTITVSFFDHGTVVDGDMIDILVNNKTVASGITLTKAPQSRTITMTEDIIVFGFRALNEGTVPPNTATVTFTSVVQGKSKQVYELKKNQKSSMNITYRP